MAEQTEETQLLTLGELQSLLLQPLLRDVDLHTPVQIHVDEKQVILKNLEGNILCWVKRFQTSSPKRKHTYKVLETL
jgi:hypothetical protein